MRFAASHSTSSRKAKPAIGHKRSAISKELNCPGMQVPGQFCIMRVDCILVFHDCGGNEPHTPDVEGPDVV
jgi:hypothetical protein